MRLFVVTSTPTEQTTLAGRYMTRADFVTWLASHPPPDGVVDPTRVPALDEALLATIDVSHVGQVIEWRMGWVFCAEDLPA